MYYEDQTADWLTVDEAARRLKITPEQVRDLVEARVLRSYRDGGLVLVQPALVSGYTA